MAEVAQSSTVNASPPANNAPAPIWHTVVLLIILLGLSLLSYFTSRRFASPTLKGPAPPTLAMVASYAATLVEEWFLFFFVLWGERLRSHVPIRARIGIRIEKDALLRDIGIAVLIWVILLIVGGVLVYVLHPPGRATVAKLLPRNAAELALFILLAISAGFCEEYIFRGYFQRQFTFWTRRIWAGVVIQAVIFGLAHGYQGLRMMSVIFCYGIILGIAAKTRRSLRPGMFAHGWLDFFSGVMGYILHAARVL